MGFSLVGIPQENIVIDHEKREIQVIIPMDITTVSFPASVTVSEGVTITPGPSSVAVPYVFNLALGASPIIFYKPADQYGSTVGQPYAVRRLAAGPLEITSPPSSISVDTGFPTLITVKNYFDDAMTSVSAIITNEQTGQQFTGHISPCTDFAPLLVCQGGSVGSFQVNFYEPIATGQYRLDIRKPNGRQARAEGLVTVRRGLPRGGDDLWNPSSPGMQSRMFKGANLFAEDQIELRLKNLNGDQYTLKPSSYAPDGTSMTVNIPAAVKPSQYTTQMIRKGELVASYGRMVISSTRSQPAFIWFSDLTVFLSPNTAFGIDRGKRQTFFYVNSGVGNVRLKFTPVANSTNPILIAVNTPSQYISHGFGSPDFTIPLTTPPGLYSIVLQHILQDRSIVEGEPFERLIEVR
ncbi:MAG: hypothetical protein EAZ91_03440 [Cytophagales bacterium]|nr:MAG: hypothetical protein EAZ91_03440 [Cytophagales bacterium]